MASNSTDIHTAYNIKNMFEREPWTFTYRFDNFFHPFVGNLIERLNTTESLSGIFDPKWQQNLAIDFFSSYYGILENQNPYVPSEYQVVYHQKEIDVSVGGPYSNYNWELFFHIPLTIAVHLSKNQRYAESQRWFHYIFDPTSNDTSVPSPQRYWKFLAFRQEDIDITQIDELMALLYKPGNDDRKKEILNGYEAIKNKPFQPHAVARTRQIAYQYCVVMKYLDNLIAWGDSLFRQDTMESINEATQIYVLAANLLGPRPQRIPPRGTVRPKTYAQMKDQGLDEAGNVAAEMETQFPLYGLPQMRGSAQSAAARPLFGILRTLYFCIPRNDKLLSYWDTVGDRLFKIRHCMNIEGVVRMLALFDPPIDPGMLVKAAAAGIDISSIVSGLNQPTSPVRSLQLIQKALELCAEVRNLGGALLSAIEKRDSEHMALLRQGHEIKIQEMTQEVRFLQLKQAEESTEALLRSRATILERYRFYQRLLGLTPDSNVVPDTFPLDRRELTEENFDEAYAALVGQYEKVVPIQAYPQLKLAGAESPANQSGASGNGQLYLNTNEDLELNQHLPNAKDKRLAANVINTIASTVTMIPSLNVDLHFWGMGVHSKVFDGVSLGTVSRIAAEILQTIAGNEEAQAGIVGRTAGYERRADEWHNQHNLAARELMQMGRQLIGSLIAEQIARHEHLIIKKQIEQSREVDQFLRDKFTNEELYTWMQGEISRLYYEYYRFAFDTARKAEQTMKRELMRPEVDATDYIKFNYWDGGRRGLLSGEALYLDVRRMEIAYTENNRREPELTRHISLRQLDPLALLNFKITGSCTVTIPEWLYDLDCPGHYMRRIKNVALSIPAVVGPYTSINCTLSLLKSSVRTSSIAGDDYARKPSEPDDRFVDYFGPIQSIVTSSGNNDSGMFETNLRDERFLPFEGAGAISTWKLDLPTPTDYPTFDYATISDVIFHIRYTARQGVEQGKVKVALDTLFQEASQSNLALLFSLRHEFSTEWYRFLHPLAENTGNQIKLDLGKERFPLLFQGRLLTISTIELLIKVKLEYAGTYNESTLSLTLAAGEAVPPADSAENKSLSLAPWNGMLRTSVRVDQSPGTFTLHASRKDGKKLDPAALDNLFLVCNYSIS